MGNRIELAGQRFGRLVVQGPSVRRNGGLHWVCKCDCGNESTINGSNLRRGLTESCGCLRLESIVARNLKHGGNRRGSRLPEYTVWFLMRRRCAKESSHDYPRYGGRGIAVCERWSSFENFLADMGRRPTSDHQIDRINNDGPYSPENCRWATRIEQCNNRGYQRILEFDGRSMTLAQWSREVKINRAVLTARLNRLRWSVDRALTTPVRKSTRRRPRAEDMTSSD